MLHNNNLRNITTEQFLDDIHGPDAHIYFNVGNKTWKNKPQTYQEAKSKLHYLNTHHNNDICYIVNAGGSKDHEINQINAVFADWDCGKDEHNRYFPLSVVSEQKLIFLNSLNSLPLCPSYIIDTRNGYQIYWLVQSGMSVQQFVSLQKQIVYYLKSDPEIVNPARVMRLPGYNWVKPEKNCPIYPVHIIVYNNCRYTFSHLSSSFPTVSEQAYSAYREEVRSRGSSSISAQNNSFSYYKDNTRSIYLGTFPQDTSQQVKLQSLGQVITYLKQINPISYLDSENTNHSTLKKAICCPFHEDDIPSAHIYRHTDNFYYLKCHGKSCNYGPATLIDIVKKQEECSTQQAIAHLMSHYKIEIDESWKKETEKIMNENINIIENITQYRGKYPNLYGCLNRIRKDLISKLKFCREHISLLSATGEPMFICSLSQYERIRTGWSRDGDIGRQNERIDRYCLLGLMRKLPDEEINNALLHNTYDLRARLQGVAAGRSRKKTNMPRTQYYSIPAYHDEVLRQADTIAAQLKELGIRMNAISRDVIMEVFGQNKARDIYPQAKFNGLSKSGKTIKEKIEAILMQMIKQQGYCRIGDVVKKIQEEYDWKQVTDRRVKKYVPGLMTKHHLQEVYANKKIREQYNIDSPGSPKVIMKKTDGAVVPEGSKSSKNAPPVPDHKTSNGFSR